MLVINEIMKRCLTFFAFFIAVFIIFKPSLATDISSCTQIDSPGTYYLTNDLYGSANAPCIIINASDVTLDCQGYTIYGPGDGWGIMTINETYSPGLRSNVVIKNCIIENFEVGIVMHADRSMIVNVSIDGKNIQNSYGIAVRHGPVSLIEVGVKGTDAGAHIVWANGVTVRRFWSISDRCLELSGINGLIISESSFNCYINLYIYGDPVNGIIYNNRFLSTGNTISIQGDHTLDFCTRTETHTCDSNILRGCRIGGNYWIDYSRNCRNDDRDSFCDYAYRIPGTNFIDCAPLAEPQPSLCAFLETNVTYMAPTDSKTINWYLGWNGGIAQPQFILVYAPQGFSVSFDTSRCDFRLTDASCTVKVQINTNNVNTGTYAVEIQVSSVDCWYRERITVNVVAQPCSGSVVLTLNPSHVNPGGQFTATISGLSNCGGTAYIKDYHGCWYGETLATCQVSDTGCSVTLTAPSSPGIYKYYACFDMNLDGSYTSGEYDYKNLNVTTGPIPGCFNVVQSGNYTLNTDVYMDSSGIVCFSIAAPNVVFDCQGHTIYGPGIGHAFFLAGGAENVEIKNCRIENFLVGIETLGSRRIRILNNFINSTGIGVVFRGEKIEILKSEIYGYTASVWISPNSTDIKVASNKIAGGVAFLIEKFVSDVEIYKNSIEVGISKILTGSKMDYLFLFRNGSTSEAIFYDNVVKGRPTRILYSLDGTTPNIKLNVPPRYGISITYNIKVGGNFWWRHSETCKDDNFDNFCDEPYEAEYGIKDEYPLARLRTFYACPLDLANLGFYVFSTEIDTPGEYRLGSDIESVTGTECFRIFVEPSPPYAWPSGAGRVNNVVFDCQGYSIKYNGSLYAFEVLSATNFTLKNCKIETTGNAKGTILYATYTNTVNMPTISLINNEIVSVPPILIATAPGECPLSEAPYMQDAKNDKINVYLYNNNLTSSTTALKIYCSLGEITKNNVTANKCMQIGNPSYFTGFGLVKAVKVYDNMFICDVNQPIVIDSNYPDTQYAWNIKPTEGVNILGGSKIGGNFWYNYSINCNDTSFDGFCDEAFVINAKNKDEYPLSITILSFVIPPIPTFPMLTPASVFFALSIGLSAALELAVRRIGSTPFGIVFAVSFISLLLLGAVTNILPGWILIALVAASAFLFGYIAVKMFGGG